MRQTDNMYLLTDGMTRIITYDDSCQKNLTASSQETDNSRCWDILQDQLPEFFMEKKRLVDWSKGDKKI